MKSFENLIKEFDETLRKFNPEEYNKLQTPLENEEIEAKMNGIGIDDDDLRSIYRWKNGEIEDSYAEIMKYGCFLSLDSISEAVDSSFYEFNPALIPLISEGEQMLLFNTNKGEHYGKLYLYSVPQLYIDYPISYYDSLEAMIVTTLAAYKMGIYQYDFDKKMLVTDRKKFTELAKGENPNSAYWIKHNPLKKDEWYEI